MAIGIDHKEISKVSKRIIHMMISICLLNHRKIVLLGHQKLSKMHNRILSVRLWTQLQSEWNKLLFHLILKNNDEKWWEVLIENGSWTMWIRLWTSWSVHLNEFLDVFGKVKINIFSPCRTYCWYWIQVRVLFWEDMIHALLLLV